MEECDVENRFKVKGNYQKAVKKLRQMGKMYNPIQLLELLVKIQQSIDNDVREHCLEQE